MHKSLLRLLRIAQTNANKRLRQNSPFLGAFLLVFLVKIPVRWYDLSVMKKRIVAIVLLVFFLLGLVLLGASIVTGRNELTATGLGFAVPVGIAVLVFKVLQPAEEENSETVGAGSEKQEDSDA